ncbi:MAG: hypothetical protein ACLP7O_11065 [Terracidiphilus sp.]
MIDIFSTAQAVLRESGYWTRLFPFEQTSILSFEDESILGFCYIFADVNTLLSKWRSKETELINHHVVRFRSAGEKSWNIYSVLLCGEVADQTQTRKARQIEENLERTRKIVACGASTREAVQRSLLPLLRLQYRPSLQAEGLGDRLRRRISTIAPSAASVALRDDVPPIEVVRLLEGQP